MAKFKAQENVLTNLSDHTPTVAEVIGLVKQGKELRPWTPAKVISYRKFSGKLKGTYLIELPNGKSRLAGARNLRKVRKK